MTAKELAYLLNGREYGSEITKEEISIAKESGLVVVFGASDDLMEFRGAMDDEVDCYDGDKIVYVDEHGIYKAPTNCDECEKCEYVQDKHNACNTIYAIWCDGEFSWTYHTEIPHETFEIIDDGEKYCRGIVFCLSDLELCERYSVEEKERYFNILRGITISSFLEKADKQRLTEFIGYMEGILNVG